MDAVDGDVLCEDGLILRTCEHGVRHPVAHLHPERPLDRDTRHEIHGTYASVRGVACCPAGCCAAWSAPSSTTVAEIQMDASSLEDVVDAGEPF